MFSMFEKKAQKKKEAMEKQMRSGSVLTNMGTCIHPADYVPSALMFIAGGMAINTAVLFTQNKEPIDPRIIGACAGVGAGSIVAGTMMASQMTMRANQKFDIVVGIAAEEARNAKIFSEILASELYKGENSFMMIVDHLSGVSDADKENLRKRYRAYSDEQTKLAIQAANAKLAGKTPPQANPTTTPNQGDQVVNPQAAPENTAPDPQAQTPAGDGTQSQQ